MHFDYGKSFFNKDLKAWAKLYLEKLPKDVNCLLTMGSSGCSIASAMIALSDRDLYHVYVKKDGERSHSPYTNRPMHDSVIAIVDDFIDSGTTIGKLLNFARNVHVIVSYIIVNSCSVNFSTAINPDTSPPIIKVEGGLWNDIQEDFDRGNSAAVP